MAPDDEPDCPEHLDEEARNEWNRAVAVLRDMGLLSRADRASLAGYCVAYSRWVASEISVQKSGTVVKSPNTGFPMKSPYLCVADAAFEQMRKLAVEFGFTPSSRSRIHLGDSKQGNALDDFLREGRGA